MMLRKAVAGIVAGLAFGAVSTVSAADMSAGGGAFFANDFGGGYKATGDNWDGSTMTLDVKFPYSGLGFYGFFDAEYVEASAALFFGGGKAIAKIKESGRSRKEEIDYSLSSFNLGVFGKYPIALSNQMTAFPIAGLDYQIVMSAKLDGSSADEAGDLSALWFKFGGGVDYAVNSQMYVRPELLYGIRTNNKQENDLAEGYDGKTGVGHGFIIKVGVGYKLLGRSFARPRLR